MQNKVIVDKQEVTHTELKFPRSQRKQKRPKTNERNVVSNEQQARHMELKSPRFSLFQYRKWLFREKRKVSHHRSTKWQVIAWSLGILCVVLIITLRVLLANLFSGREDQNQKISTIPTLSSKNGECSCDLCSSHWIGFGNSFYHLSSKAGTWVESHAACAELNSHLLKTDNKEELEILSLLEAKGWIGLQINESSESWLWEDGTTVNESLLEFLKMDHGSCAYIEGNYAYVANCSSGKSYICELTI
ncbi:killer cell lectin-like receptor subfamily I member 1 isoform 4-T5 [Dama dama]|uniref:killer cell lectin-like receptor subfamily I member 1 isoform X4 n=1 Tax=Dama dama TaxID=30532 RepID=UPI002A364E00|nr:killer cell lectin-like receptor subfamily I member 1 isoform X4 [Dama dama]